MLKNPLGSCEFAYAFFILKKVIKKELYIGECWGMKKIIVSVFMLLCSTSFVCSTAADELLHDAIEQADVKKAKQALADGADVYAHKEDERAPFEWVIWRKIGTQKNPTETANLEAIALEIIAHMPTVSMDDFNRAVGTGGSLAFVKAMRPKVADINATDKQGMTPLMASVFGYSDFGTVKYLVEQGADINQVPDTKGLRGRKNLIGLALTPGKNKNKVINYLLDQGAQATLDNVRIAATNREGDADMIKKMAAQGVDINAPLPDGSGLETVFAYMLIFGSKPDIFKYFIANGADVNARPDMKEPYSPLDAAVKQFYYDFGVLNTGGVDLEVLEAMLKKGAKVTDLTRAIAREDAVQVNKLIQPFPEVYAVPVPTDEAKRAAALKLLGISGGNKKSI